MVGDKTNIQVSRETRDRLAGFGSKGETYDQILQRIMKKVYNWDNVYCISMPVSTKDGQVYVDLIVPKVDSLHINKDEFSDTLASLCEDNDIKILGDDEVPFFNHHF